MEKAKSISVQGFYKETNGKTKIYTLTGESNTTYKDLIFIEITEEDLEFIKEALFY